MEEIIYKSITILVDSDPMNEVIHNFANMTIKRALEIFREENPNERGLILVYNEGEWKYAGFLSAMQESNEEEPSPFAPPYKHRFTFVAGDESYEEGFNVQLNGCIPKIPAFCYAVDILFERYKYDLKKVYSVYYTNLESRFLYQETKKLGVYNTKYLKQKARRMRKNEP